MKIKFTLILSSLFLSVISNSQTVLSNAILKAKMETTRENSGGNDGEGGPQIVLGGQDGELRIVIKGNKYKVANESANMNNYIYVDKDAKTTTTLFEAMGNKRGFVQTDDEKIESRKAMDSARKNQQNNNQTMGGFRVQDMRPTITIEYSEESKIINKINCKKAIITSKRQNGETSKYDLWYTPDYILPEGVDLGRFAQFRDLKGIPVMYESVNKINFGDREITMTTKFELTSINNNAEIKDKEFDIPKGYDIKTWKEWQKDNPGGGGGMRMIFRN